MDIAATADFILEAFETLGHRSLPPGSLDAKRVTGRTDTFIAVSEHRELFLLLEVDQSTLVEERRLEAIRVLSGDDLAVVDAATSEVIRHRFAVVALRPRYRDLASSFAMVAAILLATLDELPTAKDVIDFLDSLVSLLAPRRMATAATVVGLWGELWMIATAPVPAIFAAAWHSGSADRFDFSFPNARIEVKTTTGPDRVHEFGLEQLEAGEGKSTLIASVAIVSDSNGATLMDLLERLGKALPGALAVRVNRIALETVAGDIESIRDFAFAPIGAEPLLVFDSHSIPRVSVPRGTGISGVRFRADLGRVTPAARTGERLAALLRTGI